MAGLVFWARRVIAHPSPAHGFPAIPEPPRDGKTRSARSEPAAGRSGRSPSAQGCRPKRPVHAPLPGGISSLRATAWFRFPVIFRPFVPPCNLAHATCANLEARKQNDRGGVPAEPSGTFATPGFSSCKILLIERQGTRNLALTESPSACASGPAGTAGRDQSSRDGRRHAECRQMPQKPRKAG